MNFIENKLYVCKRTLPNAKSRKCLNYTTINSVIMVIQIKQTVIRKCNRIRSHIELTRPCYFRHDFCNSVTIKTEKNVKLSTSQCTIMVLLRNSWMRQIPVWLVKMMNWWMRFCRIIRPLYNDYTVKYQFIRSTWILSIDFFITLSWCFILRGSGLALNHNCGSDCV